jgi:signal transduction histidine kinase
MEPRKRAAAWQADNSSLANMPALRRTPEDDFFVFSSLPPTRTQKQLALFFMLGLLVVTFLIAGPLSYVRLPRVDAFVPAHVMAMFVNDLITAVLLFAQFSILRSRAILVLASGYLFTALVLIPYVLVFPGLLVPERGLFGGMQTTSWFWFFWHAAFPMFVISYALLKDADPSKRYWQGTVSGAISLSVAVTVAVISIAAFLTIAGEASLPPVTLDYRRLSPLWPYVGLPVALIAVAALIVLWIRRHSMIDLWLMVVMGIYAIEMPINYWPDPVRFSLGWYTIRVFAVLASGLVLLVLLYEITTLYSRLVGAVRAQNREREARLMTGDAVAASIAHEVRQPLTAMVTTADAGLRFLDRSIPNLDRAKEAFKRIVADGHRAGEVVGSIRANFRNDVRTRTSLDINELIREVLTLERGDLQRHGILVQAEPNEQLPDVQGNRIQLQQVLVNLITNAIHAMAAKDEPRVLSVKSETYTGDAVMVSVADTGTGINSQDVDQIFIPLFTTKSDGMGMGLSICRAIVEAHEGRLWFAPNNPRGTVFQFTLPVNNSESIAA